MEHREAVPFRFEGRGGDYFRIWIVNLALTLVTLGFYSPWAKVRRLRYFYGSTSLAGSSFEFHGDPRAIFKGRLIALLMLLAYSQAAKVSLVAWYAVVAVLVALLPWLLWRSLRFRLANASWRGIRFRFDGTLPEAYFTFVPLIVLVLGPTLVLAILGNGIDAEAMAGRGVLRAYFLAIGVMALVAPWFFFRLRAYRQRHARLGASVFAFDAKIGQAYVLTLKLIGLGLCLVFVSTLVGFVAGGLAWVAAPARWEIGMMVGAIVGYIAFFGIYSLAAARVQNFVWNATTLDGARFVSTAGGLRLLRIDAVNLVLSVVTVGFYWPFAAIRRARYRIEAMSWTGDPDAVANAATHALGATGDEAADLFGLDLAL